MNQKDKSYLEETALDYEANYRSRLQDFLTEFEADEDDFINREKEFFDNILIDIQDPQSTEAGYGFSNIEYYSIAQEIIDEIGFDKFFYKTSKKIKFLNTLECSDNNSNDELENDVLVSTIEDWLDEFKSKMSDSDYNTLVDSLKKYFRTGQFPKLDKTIKVGKVNKKSFGWALNQIFRSESSIAMPKEYLLFAKENISIFNETEFDYEEKGLTKTNLYTYFTTNV